MFLTDYFMPVSDHLGHHNDYFWHFLALLTVKAKAVAVAFAIAAAVAIYIFYGKQCHCPHYVQSHGTHHGPPEFYDHDRESRSIDVGLLSNIIEGIDSSDMSFRIENIENVSCRKKIVCELEKASRQQPLVKYAMSFLRKGTRNFARGDG
ncbi:unnamed protein product [Timema podura]|uniref:Uncharacterized protein n=1 Tax=Timema podura TaxID=61482 RepID=A0ABN7NHS0_TIMPD|nr:unnamed protein product [Timema podura]